MADEVTIKGWLVGRSHDSLAVLFRPKAPVFVPAVWLERDRIAVVQEAGGFVSVTLPYWLALQKGLEEYA